MAAVRPKGQASNIPPVYRHFVHANLVMVRLLLGCYMEDFNCVETRSIKQVPGVRHLVPCFQIADGQFSVAEGADFARISWATRTGGRLGMMLTCPVGGDRRGGRATPIPTAGNELV